MKGIKLTPEEWRDRLEMITHLAQSGCSASQAGALMGLTRSTILGFAWRNGIQFEGGKGGRPKQ